MTVQEFMEMFVDPDAQHIQIWSDAGEKIVYDGALDFEYLQAFTHVTAF